MSHCSRICRDKIRLLMVLSAMPCVHHVHPALNARIHYATDIAGTG